MKKANFNTLRDLPVPESWIENALAVPEAEEQKPVAVPFWRRPRFIAMAASLVLVSALSLALFLTMGNKPPVAVKSGTKTSSTEIVWTTDANGETVATEVVVIPADDEAQDGAQPTEAKPGIVRFFERLFGTEDTTDPTSAPGQSGGNANTSPTTSGRTYPTTKPNPTESGDPAETPTEGSHSPTTAAAPTEEETEDEGIIPNGPNGWNVTEPDPTASPWHELDPTESEWDPDQPTEAPAPKPTQSPFKPTVSVNVSSFAVSSINRDGGVVYCRIYDDNGNQYGDSDRFSDQHIATLTLGHRTLSYTPRDYGILPADGTYNYEFYTKSGKMLVKGSAKLSAS